MLLLGLLLACGGSPRATFDRDVRPVLERRCGSPLCHGVAPGAEAAGEVVDWDTFVFEVDDRAHATDPDAMYEAAKRVITPRDPAFSSLLREPLDPAYGGLSHRGGTMFPSPEDEAYGAVLAWIAKEPSGGEDAPPLDALERRFAADVEPALLGMGCASAACHGPSSGVPFRFDPGLQGVVSDGVSRTNREAAAQMLALTGDPAQSRLLRKMLPLHEGGVAHKGGNRSFLTGLDDDRVRPILDWICAERLAATGEPCLAEGEPPVSGYVFVRGPVAPEDWFDADTFVPGTDLWLATVADEGLAPASLENLTAGLHDGPADVRDPAVDPSGRKLLFAMRTSEDRGHELWELDLATREATQLTTSAGVLEGGAMATDREPAWGPDGEIWFVSTRAGVVDDSGARVDTDLYALDPATGAITRRTATPHVERGPRFFTIGHEAAGEVGFTALRDTLPDQAVGMPFRFPPGLETEYHQHFGVTPPETLLSEARETADGRYALVLGDLAGVWRAGQLGVLDRNFGPELGGGDPTLPVYAPPISRIDERSGATGTVGRAWRDPAPLPDGSWLVSVASDLALEDASATPDFGLVRIELEEAPDGSGARIASITALADEPGLSELDAEPIHTRPPVPVTPMAWTPSARIGVLRHQGYPMIDALLRNLSPSGLKEPDPEIVAVRLIESLPRTPERRSPIPGGTTTGLGPHGPARILAEIPLEADGSFQAEIPAGIAFRIQGLDAQGMAVGSNHNRWFDVAPGQRIPQGVPPALYTSACAVCHGDAYGDPSAVKPDPDAITSASLTLARFEDQDPRRPRSPTPCGEDTRIEIDFQRDVRPILDGCASCHAGPELDLTDRPTERFDAAYEALLTGGWVDARGARARESALVELLIGEELDAAALLGSPGVRHGELTDEEILVITRWIDLGASWEGTP